MKKAVIFLSIILCYNIYSIEKPLIKFGSNSNGYFYYDSVNTFFYPSSFTDNFYFYLSEKFNYHFSMNYKIEILYTNLNKYSTNLNELRIVKMNNYLQFDININKNNFISILTSPILDNQKGEFFFKNKNRFSYSFKTENFKFNLSYSNSYLLKDMERFYHNASFLFYFKFPKMDYIKYKCQISFDFQHYIYEFREISPLKKINFSFEAAIDFNKIDFDTIFENKNYEIEDFDIEQVP